MTALLSERVADRAAEEAAAFKKKQLNTGILQNFGCKNRYMDDIGRSTLGGWLCNPHTPKRFIDMGRFWQTTIQYHTVEHP